MRKKFLSALLLCCMVLTLLPTAALADGDVAINETNFPDENFRQYGKTEFDTKNADGPAAPVLELDSRFANTIFVKPLGNDYEYRIDDGDWQNLHYFSDLQPGTEYTITARAKGTATHEPGAVSKPLIVTTLYDMIPDDIKNKLGAVVSAYIAEYDGKDHEAVNVDMTKMPAGWNITGYATGDENKFGPQKPMIRNVSDSSLKVKTHFAHEDYAQSLIVYSYPEITPKPLNNNMIADIPNQLYTGKPIYPKPEIKDDDIKDGNMDLEEGRDFNYSYDTNTSPEQGGTVTITGMGNYKDTASKSFNIVNKITEITEDDLKDLNFPTDLVTVKCTTTNSSREYGRIPGGFDLSEKPFMENGVWKVIVHLKLSAYKDKYDVDTKKAHDLKGLGSNPHQTFTLKYVNNMWRLEGDFPKVTILVNCNGQHPQEYTITFEGNGGTPSDATMTTVNQKLPQLPKATHSGRYSFDGWYTAASGGTMITTNTEFHKNDIVYAHWTYTGSSGGSSSGRTYHTIKASSDSNGSISPSERVSVRHGRDQSFTITPDKGYEIAKVLVDGKSVGAVESYTFKNVTKNHTIEAIFMKVDDNKPMPDTFMDVPKGSYYEKAVDWAVKNGITAGTGDNYFMPDGICTRAQAVTFLWRVAGSPTPKTEVMPFEDVPEGSYYYEAVLWAAENEITVGTSATTFSPELTCSRAHIVSFLWRAAGYPSAGTVNPFTDVPENAYYINAMLWAVKQEITVGTTPSTFSPDEGCTRAQIVTFLYRARSM